MDIKHKSNASVMYGVEECRPPFTRFRWKRKEDGYYIFFNRIDWEPVEEWMTIQVNKQDWDTIAHYNFASQPFLRVENPRGPDSRNMTLRYKVDQ